jgi:hypothetical protein
MIRQIAIYGPSLLVIAAVAHFTINILLGTAGMQPATKPQQAKRQTPLSTITNTFHNSP